MMDKPEKVGGTKASKPVKLYLMRKETQNKTNTDRIEGWVK